MKAAAVSCLRQEVNQGNILLQASLILTSMKTLLLGGGEMHLSLRDPLLELMPNATVWTAFGMTECASSVTTCRLQDNVYSSSKGAVAVGHPSNGISIAIKPLGASEDPGTSSACPAGDLFWHLQSGKWGEIGQIMDTG